MKVNQDNVGLILAAFFVGIIVTLVGMTLFKQTQPAPIMITPPEPTITAVPTETPGPIQVFVNGAVAAEAVYTLPPNSILQDAVQAAGGFAPEANEAVVNLAQPLFNGAQVYIPFLTEEAGTPTAVTIIEAASEANQSEQDAATAGAVVNINTADSAQLDTLPGIGPSTAEKIVAYREENGPFSVIEEIMDVPGIGAGKFAEIRDLITIEGNE